MLKTNSQGRQLYNLVKLSTGEIVKRNTVYPNADETQPVAGLDPDLKFFPIDEDARPDVDFRLFSVALLEGIDGNVWKVRFSAVPRSKPERKAAAVNRRAVELQRHVTTQEATELLVLGIGIMIRKTKGITLTAKEQAVFERIGEIYTRAWKNLEREAAIESAIEAGQDPDLDAGWEEPVAPPPALPPINA